MTLPYNDFEWECLTTSVFGFCNEVPVKLNALFLQSTCLKMIINDCNVTLWHVRVTVVAIGTQQCILCLLLDNMSLSTTQKNMVVSRNNAFIEYLSPATIKST
jgi:hypothetical protein